MMFDIRDIDSLPDATQIDRMMLESFGVPITARVECMINESFRDSDGRRSTAKMFGVDMMLVFNLEYTVSDITEQNEMFGDYLDYEVYSKLDSCTALMVMDEGIDRRICELMRDFVDGLDKGEVLRYDDFFRDVFETDKFIRLVLGERFCDDFARSVRSDDERFGMMPHVVRIF
jgi:hypothetical protein